MTGVEHERTDHTMRYLLLLLIGGLVIPLALAVVAWGDMSSELKLLFRIYSGLAGIGIPVVVKLWLKRNGKTSSWLPILAFGAWALATLWLVPAGFIPGEVWFVLLLAYIGLTLWDRYRL